MGYARKDHPGVSVCVDRQYHFKEIFDAATGFYLRTGVLKRDPATDQEIDTGIDPFMRWMPALLDVGIMGTCQHGRRGLCLQAGVECYQDGLSVEQQNMSFENFKRIIAQVRGKAFQCALGGRGDPNKHERFGEILRYCRENGVVPNYTTSGFELTEEQVALTKRYVGAVAVSDYKQPHTYHALDAFIRSGVKTNVHYVLSKASINKAIDRLQRRAFPPGINAVIFLLHKPVGLGTRQNVLGPDDPRVHRLFELVSRQSYPFKIGFDSCSVPGILNYAERISRISIEPCEGGRFSCYISPDMTMTPCSYDQEMKYAVDLNIHTIEKAWNSERFDQFRNILQSACPSCEERNDCLGGCPLVPEITLCTKRNFGGGII